VKLNTLWKMGMAMEGQVGNWKIECGTTWMNILSETLNPSQYSLGLSYY
jgi:hypothetical protein